MERRGGEFFLHDHLYDVAKKKSVNGKLIIYCYNDKKEKKLIQQLIWSVNSGGDHSANPKNNKQTNKFQFTDLRIYMKASFTIDAGATVNYFSFIVHNCFMPHRSERSATEVAGIRIASTGSLHPPGGKYEI